jgi:hypothetical protein
MLVRRFMLVAFAATALASSAFAADHPSSTGHGPKSKDHTPLLEECAAYKTEFARAIGQQPQSKRTNEAQRLFNEGERFCSMDGAKVTQGANDMAEALRLIGARPSLL